MNNAFICFPGFKDKAVTLSYDDGVRQDKRLISIMKKYGLKGTFNINGGCFEEKYNGLEEGRMSKQEAIDLYIPSGMEVAIHGYYHYSLDRVDTDLAIHEIMADRQELERTFKRVIKGMAYANGAYNDKIVGLLSEMGVNWARAVKPAENFDLPTNWLEWAVTCHHDHPRLMELAKEFVEKEKPEYVWARKLQVFYLWGHSYEFDYNDNWKVVEEFAEYIGMREDIWYATNGEIFDYLQACKGLQYSVDAALIRNTSHMDIYINYWGKEFIVPMGKTLCWKTGELF